MSLDVATYQFGKNWQHFLSQIDPKRLEIAKQSIIDFAGVDDLQNMSVVDLGCGSGLFSWAAHGLGAQRLVSMDVDQLSIACAQHLRELAGNPDNWTITEGSILDDQFMQNLGQFDMVYSWGVLHHTGQMYHAIDNAIARVADDGYLYITIYNHARGMMGSKTWLKIKRLYNRLPRIGQLCLEWTYIAYWLQSKLFRLRNPLRIIREYPKRRGMSWRTNINDWMGGYPYEYANIEKIFKHVQNSQPRLELINLNQSHGLGTNHFLFHLRPAPTPE
jgi:2-polyprenyl-6-hydroxyphenyl methylase/3-demethylubiquinone-9 3-methyltransferase